MESLFSFLFAALVSFFGSLQLGPVTLTVVSTTFQYGKKNALWVAFGGVLPELFYSTLAIYGVEFLASHNRLFAVAHWVIIVIFFLMAIYLWFKKTATKDVIENVQPGQSFVKGFLVATLNPQLVVFWTTILIYFHDYLPFQSEKALAPKLFFIVGTAVGAFSLFITLISLTERQKISIKKILQIHINKIMSMVFLLLSLFYLFKKLFLV